MKSVERSDFELDGLRTVIHNPSGIRYSFHKYANPDDLTEPNWMGGNLQNDDYDRTELARVATEFMQEYDRDQEKGGD